MTLHRTTFSFFDLFPHVETIEVVDVGALQLGVDEVYASLIKNNRARLIAFEPDQAGYAALQKTLDKPHICFPHFISNGKPGIFYETQMPMTGSLYPLNEEVLNLYPDIAAYMQFKSTHPVETRRLDDISEIQRIDFLKLDVQGAELDILKGSINHLPNILAIHTEVEFLPLYRGQPLFADIDFFLRTNGFQFHTFSSLAKRLTGPLKSESGKIGGFNQVVWGDAVYIPDLARLLKLPPQRQLLLAAIMHEVYGSFDVALRILKNLSDMGCSCDFAEYWKRLQASE